MNRTALLFWPLLWALLAFATPAAAQRADVDAVLAAVVRLDAAVPDTARTAGALGTSRSGSGVVIDDDGLVLTVGYLILEAASVTLTLQGNREVPANVVAYDHNTGFGLVRATQPLNVTPLALGDSSRLTGSDPVLAISYGGGAGIRPAMVAARRPFAGYWEYLLEDAIYTVPPHPQFSGAALIDPDGKLLGIGSLLLNDVLDPGVPGQTDRMLPGNLFIPVDRLRPILDELLTHGRGVSTVRPWLGLYVDRSRGYLFVQRLAEDGPAARAGLAANELLVRVNGRAVATLAELYRAIWASGDAGSEVTLTVLRGGELVDVKVTSGDRYDWLRLKPSV